MNDSLSRLDLQRRGLWSVVFFGIVSLLADVTYESARSIIGPYMAVLGGSAVAISVVSGAGELVGYGLRIASGRLADRTQRYWLLVWIGYTVNLLVVPLLALVGRWEVAAVLVLAERIGKAIRAPARDALLAQATQHIGYGKGFGIHEALDQIGAVSGPLLVAAAIALGLGYRGAFGLLAIPALAALGALRLIERILPPLEHVPVQRSDMSGAPTPLPRSFYRFLVAAFLAAAGMVDFPLLAYHVHAAGFDQALVPLLYALAMGVDALAALVLGRLFDRLGLRTLAAASVVSSIAAVLVVTSGTPSAGIVSLVALAIGIAAWGVGMGAHESILRASVAVMVPANLRGRAFGSLSAWYGGAWFMGSSILGLLYHWHPLAMALAAALLQLIAAAIWFSYDHAVAS